MKKIIINFLFRDFKKMKKCSVSYPEIISQNYQYPL